MTTIKINEIALGLSLITLLIVHFLGLFDSDMMISGLVVVFSCAYVGLLWREGVYDERDEYIRAKVDRMLYILTLILLIIAIIYKTFSHLDYTSEILMISLLSFGKILMSYIVKRTH